MLSLRITKTCATDRVYSHYTMTGAEKHMRQAATLLTEQGAPRLCKRSTSAQLIVYLCYVTYFMTERD